MVRLRCKVQNYAWGKIGSDSMIYRLQESVDSNSKPDPSLAFAELWMGTHISGPSEVWDEKGRSLTNFIEENKQLLGKKASLEFKNNLPFLFKVLTVNKALSIQAHPNKALAEQLHGEQPELYRDDNHKPELAIALSAFEALLGFRPLAEIITLTRGIPEFRSLIGSTSFPVGTEEPSTIKDLYSKLMNCEAELVASAVNSVMDRVRRTDNLGSFPDSDLNASELGCLFARLALQFPGDVGCFSVFFLNYLKLQPGEAIFLAPDLPHAYLSGDCMECMANSDNVVRAGLTPKFKDVPCLLKMLDYSPVQPEALIFKPKVTSLKGSYGFATLSVFRPPVQDFAVDMIECKGKTGSFTIPPVTSAGIIIFIEGEGTLSVVTDQAVVTEQCEFGSGFVFFIGADSSMEIVPKVDSTKCVRAYRAYSNI